MEADMKAMKEQMATMMEAMNSLKNIIEANAVAIAATSVVAKVNLTSPSDINQMNHPAPMMCKFKMSTPSCHMVCLSTIRHPMWRTLQMRMSITPLLYPLRANKPQTNHAYVS